MSEITDLEAPKHNTEIKRETGRYSKLFSEARDRVNRYFEKVLPDTQLLYDAEALERQRLLFIDNFGPDQLAQMSGPELLRRMPYNAVGEQPMDHWLEFRNTEEFDYSIFGSISGGSAAKYGAWQDKATGAWRAKLVGVTELQKISEDHAMELIVERRREILSAVEVLRRYREIPPSAIDPAEFQAAIEEAAPRWHRSAWLHKYLHMAVPERVTWNATEGWSNAELSRLGIVPPGIGIYANDVLIIQYWSSLPALANLPVPVQYRMGQGMVPRDHWCLGIGELNETAWRRMLEGGYLGLGPRHIGDLTEIIAMNKKREIQTAVESAFDYSGLDSNSTDARNLIEFAYRLEEGSIASLFVDSSTVVAVGEVVGDYRFVPDDEFPHQVAVRWLHDNQFQTSRPIEIGSKLMPARHRDAVVADVEASLLASGIGQWQDFSTVLGVPQRQIRARDSDSPSHQPLPELSKLPARIVEMLERKRQIILYGPPGTGKTFHAERVARELVSRHNFHRTFAALSDEQRNRVLGRDGKEPFVESCTFHPMYSYEDFIEGYRPHGEGFSLKPGIFKRIATVAEANPNQKYVLIIDEINRGNIPRIFGELITLIEASRRGVSHVRLPLSGERFTVPDNLYLIGTMNTADRSILLLDTALRRRFSFMELMPQPALLAEGRIGDVSIAAWLRALNRRIVAQLGRDGRNLQIGHAYLMTSGGKPVSRLIRIGEILRDEIWPLLQEYCYEDPNKLSNILGDLYDRERANLRFDLFDADREAELTRALIAVLTPEDKKEDAVLEQEPEVDADEVEEAL